MYDGETGNFTEWLDSVGEVTVEWIWYDGEDYKFDGYFDIFVFQDGVDITYDISKADLNWLEEQTPDYAGYEPPTRQQIARSINAHFNKSF